MKLFPAQYQPRDFYNEAEALLKAYHKGERAAWEEVRNYLAADGIRRPLGLPAEQLELAQAQLTVARSYRFESWEKFISFVEELNRPGSAVAQFEDAVEAIINGDEHTLDKLLRQNHALVHMRSQRRHGATLLMYIGANGVEGYRQRSPRNAAEIAEILLKAGADVNASAPLYAGGATTLGLVATSVWPALAGVQIYLLETLIKYGANIDGDPEGWNPLIAALDNGRPEAATYLADHGARLTVGGAAGIGRLDLVKKFFDSNGQYHDDQVYGSKWRVPADPQKQLVRALIYACMYGHTDIAAYLIAKGVDIGAQDDDQYTGLHYAAQGGHMDTVEWLLQHGAPLEKKNCYGGTVLGQVIWLATHDRGNERLSDYLPVIRRLVEAGAAINPWWTTGIKSIDNFLRSRTQKPLPQCHTIMPELPFDNVPAAVAWYRDILGFSVNYEQHDIGVMDRDKARILLIARTEKHKGIGSCYIYVHDADALYTELRAKGVSIGNEPVSQPWGLREFIVFDPEGNRISFGQPFE